MKLTVQPPEEETFEGVPQRNPQLPKLDQILLSKASGKGESGCFVAMLGFKKQPVDIRHPVQATPISYINTGTTGHFHFDLDTPSVQGVKPVRVVVDVVQKVPKLIELFAEVGIHASHVHEKSLQKPPSKRDLLPLPVPAPAAPEPALRLIKKHTPVSPPRQAKIAADAAPKSETSAPNRDEDTMSVTSLDGAVHKAATAVKAAKAAKKTRVAALATLPTTAFNEIGRKKQCSTAADDDTALKVINNLGEEVSAELKDGKVLAEFVFAFGSGFVGQVEHKRVLAFGDVVNAMCRPMWCDSPGLASYPNIVVQNVTGTQGYMRLKRLSGLIKKYLPGLTLAHLVGSDNANLYDESGLPGNVLHGRIDSIGGLGRRAKKAAEHYVTERAGEFPSGLRWPNLIEFHALNDDDSVRTLASAFSTTEEWITGEPVNAASADEVKAFMLHLSLVAMAWPRYLDTDTFSARAHKGLEDLCNGGVSIAMYQEDICLKHPMPFAFVVFALFRAAYQNELKNANKKRGPGFSPSGTQSRVLTSEPVLMFRVLSAVIDVCKARKTHEAYAENHSVVARRRPGSKADADSDSDAGPMLADGTLLGNTLTV